jgi:BlaI family penicillinase repressor
VANFRITEAESTILAALWKRGPLSFVSLVEAVKTDRAWGDATIKTLLNRLMRKGAVKSVRDDGRQLYHPQITREAYIDAEIAALAARLFPDGENEMFFYIARKRAGHR